MHREGKGKGGGGSWWYLVNKMGGSITAALRKYQPRSYQSGSIATPTASLKITLPFHYDLHCSRNLSNELPRCLNLSLAAASPRCPGSQKIQQGRPSLRSCSWWTHIPVVMRCCGRGTQQGCQKGLGRSHDCEWQCCAGWAWRLPSSHAPNLLVTHDKVKKWPIANLRISNTPAISQWFPGSVPSVQPQTGTASGSWVLQRGSEPAWLRQWLMRLRDWPNITVRLLWRFPQKAKS